MKCQTNRYDAKHYLHKWIYQSIFSNSNFPLSELKSLQQLKRRGDSLTVGPHLEDERSVLETRGFEGVSLVATAVIPVDEPLDSQGIGQEIGSQAYHVFQAGKDGAWSIPHQIPQQSPDHDVFRMMPGDVSVITGSDLEALQEYRSGSAAYDLERWNKLAARLVPVHRGQQVVIGRNTDRRLISQMPDKRHFASGSHLIVAVSPESKVTLTDTSTWRTRVIVRPGYHKTHRA